MTLQAISGVISQELGKIGAEMRGLRDEMQRVLANIEKKVDEELLKVVQKIEGLEVSQREMPQMIVTINTSEPG